MTGTDNLPKVQEKGKNDSPEVQENGTHDLPEVQVAEHGDHADHTEILQSSGHGTVHTCLSGGFTSMAHLVNHIKNKQYTKSQTIHVFSFWSPIILLFKTWGRIF